MIHVVNVFGRPPDLCFRSSDPDQAPTVTVLICCKREERPRVEEGELVVPKLGDRGRFTPAALVIAARGRMFRFRVRGDALAKPPAKPAPEPKGRKASARRI